MFPFVDQDAKINIFVFMVWVALDRGSVSVDGRLV